MQSKSYAIVDWFCMGFPKMHCGILINMPCFNLVLPCRRFQSVIAKLVSEFTENNIFSVNCSFNTTNTERQSLISSVVHEVTEESPFSEEAEHKLAINNNNINDNNDYPPPHLSLAAKFWMLTKFMFPLVISLMVPSVAEQVCVRMCMLPTVLLHYPRSLNISLH